MKVYHNSMALDSYLPCTDPRYWRYHGAICILIVNILRPGDANCVGDLGHRWFSTGDGLSPSASCYCSNQSWLIVNWTPRSKLWWDLNQYMKRIPQENAHQCIVCTISAILFRPHFIKTTPHENDTDPVTQIRIHYGVELAFERNRPGLYTPISHEVSKPRDWVLAGWYSSEIRQQCCRDTCQISELTDYSKINYIAVSNEIWRLVENSGPEHPLVWEQRRLVMRKWLWTSAMK